MQHVIDFVFMNISFGDFMFFPAVTAGNYVLEDWLEFIDGVGDFCLLCFTVIEFLPQFFELSFQVQR